MRARLRWLCLSVIVALAGLLHAVDVLADPSPTLAPVVLPRDHGAHPAFQFEWWYTAGTVTGRHHDYFWFATLWAGGGYAVAKVNVVDLRADRIVLSREYLAKDAFSSGQSLFTVGGYKLRRRAVGKLGRWSIDAGVPGGGSLRLTLTPIEPYLLEAPQGIIRLGNHAATAYYSAPRVAASGSLVFGGHSQGVTGTGWLDHQWGSFASGSAFFHWNWFACQFRNGSNLMLYQFIKPGGQPLGVQDGTFVSARGNVTHPRNFTVAPLTPIIRPVGAAEAYPLRWQLDVPSAGIQVTIRARARHQFIANQLIPSFWEGAASITRGSPGTCIVESTREPSTGL